MNERPSSLDHDSKAFRLIFRLYSKMKAWLRKGKRIVGYLVLGKPQRGKTVPSSLDYALIDLKSATHGAFNGWHDSAVAERQDAAYQALIQQMYAGQPREDLVAAAEAVRHTRTDDPLILEVGCGSGYYSEILSHLLRLPVRYVGMDYSQAMVRLACEIYPNLSFVGGDGTALPFADASFDIVLNGVALMHILRYEAAIAESRRVARRWAIFHTVPVQQSRETTVLSKQAYGQATIEVIFNERELHHLFEQGGLVVRHILNSIPYDLNSVLGESIATKTYMCEVTEC